MSVEAQWVAAVLWASGVVVLLGLVFPRRTARVIFWIITHSLYRLRIIGRLNIPAEGGALLVCNHLSLVDNIMVAAASPRYVRFVMWEDFYDHPLIWPFAKLLGAIRVPSKTRPRETLRALRRAGELVRNGEVVCIYAEGEITRLGQLLPFRRGFERVMSGVNAPLIPVHLDGLWDTIFSFRGGRMSWKVPRRLPHPVTVSFGEAMAPDSTALEVRRAVAGLHTAAFTFRRDHMRPLHRSFMRSARLHPFRFAMADMRVEGMSYLTALIKTVFLARRLRKVWDGQEMVGIMLPPSIACALTNFAAMMMGKVPVNLNYTSSDQTLEATAQVCGLRTVVTSRAFLEKVTVKVPGEAVLLEDLAENPGRVEKLAALAMALFLPASALERKLGRQKPASLDELATVIFSSGSTGEPKGVMLSHYNVAANIEQMVQTFYFDRHDRMLGVLPIFHSFGFTVTMCLPSVLSIGVVYYPTPLEPQAIGELTHKYRCTFLLATPTFLQNYTRRCTAEQFASLRYVLVGAEKLQAKVAAAFEEKFHKTPLEGYGCTECSPVVSVNIYDYVGKGVRQIGGKRSKIGRPVPGLSVQIVDPETGQARGIGEAGLLLVKGPNVMLGYLNRPDETAKVLRDGWYVTGDIAALDEDGFLCITDRLSRFSKIGGEMVPHLRVEEKLHEVAGATEPVFAVTGVPDEKKGERLVVLHTLSEECYQDFLRKFSTVDLPALWKPRPQQFYRIEAVPYLGTGKLDLRRVKEIALELAAQSQTGPEFARAGAAGS